MDKVFAPQYQRNELGLIMFPNDEQFRRQSWFIQEAMLHPAKANLHMIRELIEYTSNPGQRVMDITAGTGSILIAAQMGRVVTAIELSPEYAGWIERSASIMGVTDKVVVLNGDCRSFLPVKCDSIIFSPPYAGAMKITNTGISRREAERGSSWQYAANVGDKYSELPGNLGNLSNFLYNEAMEKIYRLCYQSLSPGGMLSLIIKDRIKDQEEQALGYRALQLMAKAGFKPYQWFQWAPPGSIFTKIHKAHGLKVVEVEHIIICRKPED